MSMRTVLITLIGPERTTDLVVDADTPVSDTAVSDTWVSDTWVSETEATDQEASETEPEAEKD